MLKGVRGIRTATAVMQLHAFCFGGNSQRYKKSRGGTDKLQNKHPHKSGGGLTYRWLRIIISVITWYIFCFAASFCGNSSLCILALLMSGTHRHIDKRPCRLANRECHIYITITSLLISMHFVQHG